MNAPCRELILALVIIAVPGCNGAERKTGTKMETQPIELPFQLKPQDLLNVEFTFEYFPPHSKAWSESIRLSGMTGTTLVRHVPGVGKPDTIHGKQDPQALVTLLKLYEDAGFFEKEVDVDVDNQAPLRFLSLAIPGRSNRVAIGGRYQYQLGSLLGAMRLAAGFSVPEALTNTFLHDL